MLINKAGSGALLTCMPLKTFALGEKYNDLPVNNQHMICINSGWKFKGLHKSNLKTEYLGQYWNSKASLSWARLSKAAVYNRRLDQEPTGWVQILLFLIRSTAVGRSVYLCFPSHCTSWLLLFVFWPFCYLWLLSLCSQSIFPSVSIKFSTMRLWIFMRDFSCYHKSNVAGRKWISFLGGEMIPNIH